MLAIKRSAAVAPEANLWNPLHTGDKACQKSKTGVPVSPQKAACPPILFEKKEEMNNVIYLSVLYLLLGDNLFPLRFFTCHVSS